MVMTETPTYPLILPLSEAARKMGMDEATLRAMVQSRKLRAFIDPEGVMYVQMTQQGTLPLAVAEEVQQPPADDINARLSRIRREDFAHLEGQLITLTEASQEFGIPRGTLRDWLYRGYIHGEGKYPTRVNKADVAYCAAIYQVRKKFKSRAPLLDKDGKPYLLKEPELARLRRLAKL